MWSSKARSARVLEGWPLENATKRGLRGSNRLNWIGSSSKSAWRTGVLALMLMAGTAGLAGCSSFTPVYGDTGIGASLERNAFAYGKPKTRLEQIIYQDLILRFGRAAGTDVPTIRVATSTASRELTKSDVTRPSDQHEATVTAAIEIVAADGSVVFSGDRSASALYATSGQVLADTEAQRDAEERAARALAETIRLTILGVLGKPVAG